MAPALLHGCLGKTDELYRVQLVIEHMQVPMLETHHSIYLHKYLNMFDHYPVYTSSSRAQLSTLLYSDLHIILTCMPVKEYVVFSCPDLPLYVLVEVAKNIEVRKVM